MAAIAFTDNALLNVKRGLRSAFPDRKSSHLTEALAAACGFRSQASLLAQLRQSDAQDPDFLLLDDEAFIRRLYELEGEQLHKDEDFYWFEAIWYPDKNAVATTQSTAWWGTSYANSRSRAWRNIMVSAINEGIRRRLFSIRPGDNRWPGQEDEQQYVYRFSIGDIPAICSISDIGQDELSIHCALWPQSDAEEWIGASGAGFAVGDALASGWLERRDGAWLQFNGFPQLNCRKNRLALISAIEVTPSGFADRGDLK